jgi:hypothetical protein
MRIATLSRETVTSVWISAIDRAIAIADEDAVADATALRTSALRITGSVPGWMVAGSNNHVKVARTPGAQPRIAFAGNANALAIARPCLDTDFERFGTLHAAFPVAGSAG